MLDALSEQLESQVALSAQLKALVQQYQQTLAASEHKDVTIQGDKATVIQQGEQGQVIIRASISGDAVGPGGAKSIGGDAITGEQVIIVQGDATIVSNTEALVKITTVERESALGRYLQYIISRNRYLQLQGIRSGDAWCI